MKKYKCPNCDWVGTEPEMRSDYITFYDGGEVWTDHACPSCDTWYELEDYIEP